MKSYLERVILCPVKQCFIGFKRDFKGVFINATSSIHTLGEFQMYVSHSNYLFRKERILIYFQKNLLVPLNSLEFGTDLVEADLL